MNTDRSTHDATGGETMAQSPVSQQWLAQLAASYERTIDRVRAGRVEARALRSVADLEAFFALNLTPMPVDPVAHIQVGYAKTRPYLEWRYGWMRRCPRRGRSGSSRTIAACGTVSRA
jgi:hypothetical protein